MCLVSVSVPTSRKRSWRGTWETPATFGFGAEAAQLPSSPPPNVALSEPLPGGLQGWLRAVSDMRTCGPAPRRSARWRSSDPTEQRKRSPGNAAMGQADRDRDWCNGKTRKTTQNCKLKRDAATDGGRQSSTQKDADSAPGGAVQALKSDDNGQDCRWWKMVEGRVVTSLVVNWLDFGQCKVEIGSSACAAVHTHFLCYLWSSWSGASWKKKQSKPLG